MSADKRHPAEAVADEFAGEGDEGADGTAGEESKEAKMSIRLLVGSKDAGGLIGKAGVIVKKLREDTGAVIDIADPVPRALKRIVTVKGTLPGVMKALSQISEKLAERRRGARKAGRSPEHGDEGDDTKNSLTLLIANAQVGCVIGKGGEQIRATRLTSGANVKVSEKMLEGSTEKSVLIEGTGDQVAKACELIAAQLLMTQDRAVAKVPYVPRPTFGLEGTPYPGLFYDQYTMAQLPMHLALGPSAFPAPHSGSFAGRVGGGGGGAGGHGGAGAPMVVAGAGGAGGGGGGGASEPSVLISVAEAVVGSIIGRGGAVIKEIRQRSRAQIRIGDPSPTGGDRTITITGSRQCNEVAIALVYEKIAAAEGYRKMGGDGGGRSGGRRGGAGAGAGGAGAGAGAGPSGAAATGVGAGAGAPPAEAKAAADEEEEEVPEE